MSERSNAGYTDAIMGAEPRSDDPEYLAGYRKAKGSLAAGGWQSLGGGVHIAPNIAERPFNAATTSFGQVIREDQAGEVVVDLETVDQAVDRMTREASDMKAEQGDLPEGVYGLEGAGNHALLMGIVAGALTIHDDRFPSGDHSPIGKFQVTLLCDESGNVTNGFRIERPSGTWLVRIDPEEGTLLE